MATEADQFFDTLNYVFQFLRAEGFTKAEETLRSEISSRFELPDEGSNDPSEDKEYVHDHPGPPTPAVEEPNLPDPRIGQSEVPSTAPPVTFSIPSPSPVVSSPSSSSKGRISHSHSVTIPEVQEDEYESMDDTGYYRREVIGQQQFVDTELVLSDEEDARDMLSHGSPPVTSPVSPQSPPSPQSPQSPQSQSSSGTAASLQYSSEPPRSPSPVSISASEPAAAHSDHPLNEDESWALGPTDIKIVDPVIALDNPLDDLPVPTLRRVESLSNSFKDDNDGLDSCANSHVDSEFDQCADQGTTVDLLPAAPQSYMPEFKGVFDSVHDIVPGSPSSSLDVQQSEISDAELGGQKATLIIQTITNNSNREDGFGGGFSFPITPPTSEPDQLFSSWPSFRSPTSEASPDMPGSSDDESQPMLEADVAEVFPVLPSKADTNGTAEIAVLSWPELTAHMISLSMEDYTEAEVESDAETCATSKAHAVLSSATTSPVLQPPPPPPAIPDLAIPGLVLPDAETETTPTAAAAADSSNAEEAKAPAEATEELSPRSRRTWELTASAEASAVREAPAFNPVTPAFVEDEDGKFHYVYNEDYIQHKYEVFTLNIIHRRHRTGFEESKDFPIRINDLIAGRYQVLDCLGSAAFSRAVQALDIKEGTMVCLKIIKNNKDYFDQSLDEIKLLHFVNNMDPNDEHGIVRLYDYFYYKEHLFLVCELLRANLYEFQKFNRESSDPPYFTLGRIQKIAIQVLRSLQFLHSLDLIHSDLKPENILIKSYSNCEVKVIDLGSSCFITDHLSSYVQSRSYRAPEVILGLPYDHKIDIWSLGCILAELSSGYVLFQNDSLATLLARLEGILGPIPSWMIQHSKYGARFYTRSNMLYEINPASKRYEILVPKRTSLKFRMPEADDGFCDFVRFLLAADPHERPSAAEALKHPWLQQLYPED